VEILWRFLGQRPRLDRWEREPLSPTVEAGPRPGDRHNRFERGMAREAPGPPEPGGPYERLARAVLAYRVFPPQLVVGVLRRVPVRAGDTFGTCCHFLPGIDLFFAGRVSDVFAGRNGDAWRAGFSFHTVRGHPMIGEETFWVEKDAVRGEVRAGLRSWSRPGSWLTRVGLRFLRWYQARASHAALRHLARVATCGEKSPPAPGASEAATRLGGARGG
jgi:hypothetical protein